MAKSALLTADPITQKKVIYHEEDGKTYVETQQDVEGLIDGAKIMSQLPHDRDMKPVAVIPDTVLNDAFVNGWFHDERKWRQWANNPDNRKFRITEGRL